MPTSPSNANRPNRKRASSTDATPMKRARGPRGTLRSREVYPVVVSGDVFLEQRIGDHVATAERVNRVLYGITDVYEDAELIPSEPATEEDLYRVHTPQYVELVQAECAALQDEEEPQIGDLSTGDVKICPASERIARHAAGGGITALNYIRHDDTPNRAFVVPSIPGHHAESDRGMGFCIYNNVVVTARHAQAVLGYKRILIVDWDVHHGNGTQETTEEDSTILYLDTHRSDQYPGTGEADETGVNNSNDNNPISPHESRAGSPRERLLATYAEKIAAIFREFNPDLVLLSCGFDAHKDDPMNNLGLEDRDFEVLTTMIAKYDVPIISFLEGGYNLDTLGRLAGIHFQALRQVVYTDPTLPS